MEENRFATVLKKSDMNIKEFSEYFGIPYHTVQKWNSGERKCTDYIINLIEYKLEKEKNKMRKNTIRLLRGERFLTKKGYENFTQGECVCADGVEGEELKRWNIAEENEAKAELSKYHCEYRKMPEGWLCIEYALEYFTADEDGDFIEGSDFDFAEEL